MAKEFGITSVLSKGGEVVNEPQLPYSVVHYPPKRGFFFAFSEHETSNAYFCECNKAIMQALADTIGLQGYQGYILNITPKAEAWKGFELPQALLSRLKTPEVQANVDLVFQPGLCHACNQVVPTLLSSTYSFASFAYERLYWYTKQLRALDRVPSDFHALKAYFELQPDRFAISLSKAKNDLDAYKRCHRQYWNETQMATKELFGLASLGGSSQAENLLLSMVRNLFPSSLVQQKVRPAWLENLELDIWVPHLNLGIEYQGEQHYKPIDHWGGEESFKALQLRDKRKRELCKVNGVSLLEIRFDQQVDVDGLARLIQKAVG